MSYADGQRILAIEKSGAALLARVAVLEEMVADACAFSEARLMAQAPAGAAAGGRDRNPSSQRSSGAPGGDAVMADVVSAIRAGQSIRNTADMLGLDRSKVARLRQRAIADGCLSVSPGVRQLGAGAARTVGSQKVAME